MAVVAVAAVAATTMKTSVATAMAGLTDNNVSIHILRSVAPDYGELLAYWFILHGYSMLDRGSRPVSFHNSLAGFTT